MTVLNNNNIVITNSKLRPDKIYDETYKMKDINSCAWCGYRSSCVFVDKSNKDIRMCFRFIHDYYNFIDPYSDKTNLYINVKNQYKLIELLKGRIV